MSRIKRKKHLINGRLQLAVTIQLTYAMFAMCVIYAFGLALIPPHILYDMTGPEVLQVMMIATALYFILTTAVLWRLAVVSTNRIAGPVYVIRRALMAMHKGDYGMRVSLRRRDHLKDVAATVADMQTQLRERSEKLKDLRSCLVEGDQQAALELLDQLDADSVQAASADVQANSEVEVAEPVAAS